MSMLGSEAWDITVQATNSYMELDESAIEKF